MEYGEKLREVIDKLRFFGYSDHQIKELLTHLFIREDQVAPKEQEEQEEKTR